jgi:hypothetical protein
MFDYALGGKDNYMVDRQASETVRDTLPTALGAVQENRRFMRRAVRYLLAAGVRQFLDIGCGFPGRGNVHDLAHATDPSAAVVYVDCQPLPGAQYLGHGLFRCGIWRPRSSRFSGTIRICQRSLWRPV